MTLLVGLSLYLSLHRLVWLAAQSVVGNITSQLIVTGAEFVDSVFCGLRTEIATAIFTGNVTDLLLRFSV
jgi:hypothetical protein